MYILDNRVYVTVYTAKISELNRDLKKVSIIPEMSGKNRDSSLVFLK